MSLARKIVLHSPVSDESLLEPFVEQCILARVSLLAIFGPGSADLEETIDWIVVGDGSDSDRFLCTTSHEDEPFDDVMNMAVTWEYERGDPVQIVRL